MGTLNDDELHKMVQDAFDEYRPDTSPKDWALMQQKLWKAKLWKWAGTTATTAAVVVAVWVGVAKFEDGKKIESVAKPSDSFPIPVDIVGDNTNKGRNTNRGRELPVASSSPLLVLSPTTSREQPPSLLPSSQRELNPRVFEEVNKKIPLQFLKSQPLDFLNRFASLANKELNLTGITIPKAVPDFMSDLGTTYEITPSQVLDRQKDHWKNVVVVCDLTSSMYVYSKQVIQWFEKNQNNPNIKGVVFFTDCDSLGHQTDGNLPGKMFVSRSLSSKDLLPIAHEALKNTEENQDTDENNMEALVYASRTFADATDIVLIADNSSGIKDFYLWPLVQKPVHVIVCGETYQEYQAIQPDLMKLAKFTKGSLHTLEDDINDLNTLPNNSWIRVGGRYFQYRFGVFFPSENTRRPSLIPLGRP